MINPLNYICHRKKDRTFQIIGVYFPVCARCTGIYIGVIISYIFIESINPILSFILLIPMGLDGVTQKIGLRESNNILRLITGLLGGIGIVMISKFIGKAIIQFV